MRPTTQWHLLYQPRGPLSPHPSRAHGWIWMHASALTLAARSTQQTHQANRAQSTWQQSRTPAGWGHSKSTTACQQNPLISQAHRYLTVCQPLSPGRPPGRHPSAQHLPQVPAPRAAPTALAAQVLAAAQAAGVAPAVRWPHAPREHAAQVEEEAVVLGGCLQGQYRRPSAPGHQLHQNLRDCSHLHPTLQFNRVRVCHLRCPHGLLLCTHRCRARQQVPSLRAPHRVGSQRWAAAMAQALDMHQGTTRMGSLLHQGPAPMTMHLLQQLGA
jgi:hypothetical protein